MLGQMVRTLLQGMRQPGDYSVVWDGKDDFGRQVTSGQYFYQIKAGEFQSTRRMLLLQ
ncbi:MAG: FlgD immunoglobulin-like domain containing protein [Lysobacterales bacterium]